ncbi:MAG: cell filamentation protein Fic [Acidobacteria bacterium]|nr:MAG: cell filamentation protein Fic [Acidobacteriota bacterium]
MPAAKSQNRLGTYITSSVSGESVRAYIPPPLPPVPALKLEGLFQRLDRANQGLGRLNGMTKLLPDIRFLLYLYVRKEALVSSQIEGTQSSFADLLMFENKATPHVAVEDVEEVSNYVAALQHGLRRLTGGFPLSLRLIREIHEVLLTGGRGANNMPGEFRRSQNWIGGTRPGNASFVPPPPERLMGCLDDFEKFLHDDQHKLPVLVEAGLVHVQFESIHPFLDGNGRVGRLLITLLLCAKGALSEPLLYPSLYLKTNRTQYYDLLQRVRSEGAWEDWLAFFLEGVASAAQEAAETAERTLKLFARDRGKIEKLGRPSESALRVHELMQMNPYIRIRTATKALKLTVPTVTNALSHLVRLGIVKEVSGKQRDRLFAYSRYVSMVSAGTEPLS